MTKNQKKLVDFFEEGKAMFFRKERVNILSGVSERNLCGRLALYLELLLPKYNLEEYFCDTEYNRKQNGKIKTILDENHQIITINCDLIIHSRGLFLGKDNMVAIEMKKSNRPDLEKLSDRNRLRALTKSSFDDVWSYDGKTHPEHVCGYKLGIFFEIDIEKHIHIIEGFMKGEKRFRNVGNF